MVVVGSGPNGLVAACVLARAGLEVVVVEAKPHPGGAARTTEKTLPGFLHDVGAGFFPFGTLSPAFKDLDLPGAGLELLWAPIDSAHPARDGSCGVIGRDVDRCAEMLGKDGKAFTDWARWWAEVEPSLLPALLATPPAVREMAKVSPLVLAKFARLAAMSCRGLAEHFFETDAARRIIPALALHTDVAPSDPLGSPIGFMLAATSTTGGFSVPRGGAGSITRALLARLAELGGRIEYGARVRKIRMDGTRAVGVETVRGPIDAKVAVVADTAAPTLYLELLPSRVVPGQVLEKMRTFKRGFGTFKMDWALDAPVPWTSESCREAGVVHTGEDIDDLDRFAKEIHDGKMPTDPYLVIGQQSLVDSSRAPKGKHTLWAYSRVPSELDGKAWTAEAKATYAARIEKRIEELAPGFGETILERDASSPQDLFAMNENLLGGDLGGGTAQITNQVILRPMFPYYRYRTPINGLYLGSSYAHPGAGVHGMCGYNAANAVLEDAR
ncbi:MAG: NAD(P)/FAD-dependent oxidoreductase [Polyangiaceae bacterium]|nr:NAD(P)/FAD-dependent oxidoreductase [Polyangiaceae bacterium]